MPVLDRLITASILITSLSYVGTLLWRYYQISDRPIIIVVILSLEDIDVQQEFEEAVADLELQLAEDRLLEQRHQD